MGYTGIDTRQISTIAAGVTSIDGHTDTEVAAIKAKTDLIDAPSNAMKRRAGQPQIFRKAVTEAANAGAYALATATVGPVVLRYVTVRANTASQTDLTSAAITCASAANTLLSATDAAKANIDGVGETIGWAGAMDLNTAGQVIMDLVGGGATPVDLLVTIGYEAATDGAYLA